MTIKLSSAGNIIVPGAGPGPAGGNRNLPTAYSGLSFRNVLQNGDFRVNQKASSSYSNSGTASILTVDRWVNTTNGVGSRNISRPTAASFPGYYYRRTMTSAGTYSTTTSYEWVAYQSIEAQNAIGLGLAGNSWNRVTVSGWFRASLTGNFSIFLGIKNSSGTTYYCYQMTSINTANKWEYKSVTFNVSSAANCPEPIYDTAIDRIQLFVAAACNTGYQGGTAGTWSTSNFFTNSTQTNFCASNGATFDIARLQMEIGDVPTPFEHIPFAIELQRCHRYYQKSYEYSVAPGTATFNGGHGATWGTRNDAHSYLGYLGTYWRNGPMRAAPTVTLYAPNSGTAGAVSLDNGSYVDRSNYSTAIESNIIKMALPGDGTETSRGIWFHYVANADAVG